EKRGEPALEISQSESVNHRKRLLERRDGLLGVTLFHVGKTEERGGDCSIKHVPRQFYSSTAYSNAFVALALYHVDDPSSPCRRHLQHVIADRLGDRHRSLLSEDCVVERPGMAIAEAERPIGVTQPLALRLLQKRDRPATTVDTLVRLPGQGTRERHHAIGRSPRRVVPAALRFRDGPAGVFYHQAVVTEHVDPGQGEIVSGGQRRVPEPLEPVTFGKEERTDFCDAPKRQQRVGQRQDELEASAVP